jgi:DNA-binding protein HU-beta
MTKPEFVRELAEELELPRKQVAHMLETMLEKITHVLKSGDKVALTPFGQFKVRHRKARIARNPQTGEPVKVPAKRVLKFLAGRYLKEAVGTAKKTAAKKAAPKRAVRKVKYAAPKAKAVKHRAMPRKAAAKRR